MHPSVPDIFEKRTAVELVQTAVQPQTALSDATSNERPPTRQREAIDRWRKPFSVKEVLLSSVFLVVLSAALVALLARYPFYQCCYHQLSAAIRHWNFKGVDPSQPKEFWGFSYLSALVASVTRLPDIFAIVVVSSTAFVLANYLCCRLWGTTVAAWFMVVNWWWIDSATEGLSEPLFIALLFGSFLAIRKQQWAAAALLASGATVVRPAGIFALVAIALVLIVRREWRQLAIASAIGLVTGILYVIPLMLIYGDPLANIRGYHLQDWASAAPVTIPLLPLIRGALMVSDHWKLQTVITAWVVLTLAGVIKLATDKRFRLYSKDYPAEVIFAGLYAALLFSYNAPLWAWEYFPRFVIPLLPFLLLVLLDRLPKDRRLLWAVALTSVGFSVFLKVH